MDPLATLLNASELLDGLYGDDADFDGFYEAMQSYAAWRRRGGFEPIVNGACGDVFYSILSSRFGALAGSAMRDAKIPDLD